MFASGLMMSVYLNTANPHYCLKARPPLSPVPLPAHCLDEQAGDAGDWYCFEFSCHTGSKCIHLCHENDLTVIDSFCTHSDRPYIRVFSSMSSNSDILFFSDTE